MKYIQIGILLTVMLVIGSIPAIAAEYNVSGWVLRSDTGAGVSGIVVSNSSNTTQTGTTNASGGYFFPTQNNTGEFTLSIAATAGYTKNTSVKYNVNGAANTTRNVTMILITPAVSAVTETTPTLSGDTVSWTVTATDNLNDNYVGNRIKYSTDSDLAANYFILDWSNNTASPSFTLSNLRINTKYYYQVETYNQLNSAYYATTTGDFTTKSGTSSHYTPVPTYTVVQSPTPLLSNIPGGANGMVILVIIAVLAYFVLFGTGSRGSKKGRK